MCSACGIPTHVLEPDQVAAPPAKFAALRNADCRPYLFGAALAMMADNIEHVITYWVLWQKFHSPALAGFEVISPVGRGRRGQYRLPDTRVADAWMQQDERRAVASAVVGPYLTAVDGDHHLGHKPGLSHTALALSPGFRGKGPMWEVTWARRGLLPSVP